MKFEVLSKGPFGRLWRALAVSSLGDWLGLLASTALAQQLAGGDYTTANLAIAGVFIVRLAPALLLGPLAGFFADRFDRRWLMVSSDIIRFALYLSIPIVGNFFWLYTATLLAEVASLFWSPAKEATIPNLVSRDKLESANQAQLLAAYGTAPLAAILFSLLSLFNSVLSGIFNWADSTAADFAFYLNAFSFLYVAFTVHSIRDIPRKSSESKQEETFSESILGGWKFIGNSKVIRGLTIGMVGAFVAAGVVIALARTFVDDLSAGETAYGVLFGSVFAGLAIGIALGPKVFSGLTRKSLFGMALSSAGFLLIVLALMQNLVLAIIVVLFLGAFSGLCWVTGFTMLGLEVTDEIRGRTFAFIQSLVRVVLILVLAVAPLIAAAIGRHTLRFFEITLTYNGAAFTMLLAGLVAFSVGLLSYQQMRDERDLNFLGGIRRILQSDFAPKVEKETPGYFIVFEGGEASGKSTQTKILRDWIASLGIPTVLTREPGGTPIGTELREILLSRETGAISPRAEALLYAADRAHHVFSVIFPALQQGHVVISDRYMDSSIAYQGAGRVLKADEVARISRWATEGLVPHLTIILDQPSEIGLGRIQKMDRLESESLEFHDRVRKEYAHLAAMEPERYLVVDANKDIQEIAQEIKERVKRSAPRSISSALGGK